MLPAITLPSLIMALCLFWSVPPADAYDIGVFYFPGWNTGSVFWKDIKGEATSRSPGVPWPDRVPLLGHYPEEETWVAERHIDWAAANGISFFAYDWYWYGKNPDTEHAQKAFLKAKNRDRLKFCLHWANHNTTPATIQEFDDMVAYWLANYFKEPNYFQIDRKPVIFLFSYIQLETNARGFGETVGSLLERARLKVRAQGYQGIYFVAITNEKPDDALEKRLLGQGFSAYTGWNYVLSRDSSKIADYSSMVDTYLAYYQGVSGGSRILPYFVPASPGFDDRPWYGAQATVRSDPTPEKFGKMLSGAKTLLDDPKTSPKILMIESWNEFAEGSVIEPTKKWGVAYLETIRKIFASPPAKATVK
jgi:hypothetical protein